MRLAITLLLLINTCMAQVLISPSGSVLTNSAGDILERDALPNEIAGLAAWYKGDGGKTLVGSNVSQWNDMSGNGWNITQSNASAYPLFVSSAINGLPALYFDGGDKLINALFSGLGTSTGFTIFICARASSIPASNNNFSMINFAQTIGYGEIMFNASNRVYVKTTSSTTNFAYATFTDVSNYYNWAYMYSGAGATNADKMMLYKNTTLQSLTFSGTIPSAIGFSNGISIGGAYTSTTNLFNGFIAEVVIYNRTLTPVELAKIQRYMFSRYAV